MSCFLIVALSVIVMNVIMLIVVYGKCRGAQILVMRRYIEDTDIDKYRKLWQDFGIYYYKTTYLTVFCGQCYKTFYGCKFRNKLECLSLASLSSLLYLLHITLILMHNSLV